MDASLAKRFFTACPADVLSRRWAGICGRPCRCVALAAAGLGCHPRSTKCVAVVSAFRLRMKGGAGKIPPCRHAGRLQQQRTSMGLDLCCGRSFKWVPPPTLRVSAQPDLHGPPRMHLPLVLGRFASRAHAPGSSPPGHHAKLLCTRRATGAGFCSGLHL
jgi:hypothetical protein